MKKLVLASWITLALPFTLGAQSIDDDLYFIPKKKKTEEKTEQRSVTTTPAVTPKSEIKELHISSGKTTVTSGEVRDVDEYNRRYKRSTYGFEPSDTLYIEEDELYADEDTLDVYEDEGEWVNGFEGTQEDYEYATRLIRFRSPRVAVPVSSPLYWDIVYTWPLSDWNVYTDGFYAYAFPTYHNAAWWSWHYDPWHWHTHWGWYGGWDFHFGWGWHG